jgi:hypothetical protein
LLRLRESRLIGSLKNDMNLGEATLLKAKIFRAAIFAISLGGTAANAATIQTYGDVSSGPSGYTITSDPAVAPGYGGIYYDFSSSTTTLSDITNISAVYQFLEGTIGPGAPRFSIGDTTSNLNNEAYVYFGSPAGGGSFTDSSPTTQKSTGNVVTDPDLRVQINGFNGDSTGASDITFADFLQRDGAAAISFISLDLDAGFAGAQQLLVSDFTVATAVPEPSTWAMMMLGFCGLGFVKLRRWRLAAAHIFT